MKVLSDLLNDFTGWLTIGIIVFMLIMMAYLIRMFVSKATKGE